MASKDDFLSRNRSLRDRRMQKSMQEKELQLKIKEGRMAEKIQQLYEEKDKNRALKERIAALEYQLGKKGQKLKKMESEKKRIHENLKNAMKKRNLFNEKNNALKNDAIQFLSQLENELISFEQISTIFNENKALKEKLNKIKNNIKNKQNDLSYQSQLLTEQENHITKKLQKSIVSSEQSSSTLHDEESPLPNEKTPVTDEKTPVTDEKKTPIPPQINVNVLGNVNEESNGTNNLLVNSATSPIKANVSEIIIVEPESKADESKNDHEQEFVTQHESHTKKGKKRRHNKLNVKIESQTNIIKRQISIGASVSASPFKFEEKLLKEQKKKLKKKGNPLKTKISRLEKELNKANKTIEILTQEKQELIDKLEQN